MGKNIVLCCDGTGQTFQENKSNPLRLHYCLKNDDKQVSFYDPGVGTFDPEGRDWSGGFFSDLSSSIAETLKGGGLGYGIVKNIQDGYRYLMQTFEDGDKVYIFGFSRGAFTAQAIAGLLHKCGLIYPHNENLIPYTLEIYLTKGNDRIAKEYKETMCQTCNPQMLGVWDTVKSLGRNHQTDFFYENVPNGVACAYHALAIDEKREDFVPNIWDEGKASDGQNIEQVWFPGVHGDVGGGYPEDGLANVALKWMVANARKNGVHLQDERVSEFDPDPLGVIHESYEGGWTLRGEEIREIAEGAKLHESVFERRNHKNEYDPPNFPAKPKTVSTYT